MNEIIRKEEMFVKNEDGDMVVADNALAMLRNMEEQRKAFDKQYSKVKSVLLDGMEEYGIKKVETDDLRITYIEETERYSIDTKMLWAKYKDVAFKCEKSSKVKASVRIALR